jgi:hypothetical protein
MFDVRFRIREVNYGTVALFVKKYRQAQQPKMPEG